MGNRIGNSNYFGKHEVFGNRELKHYKDIYGNDVRLMTSKEKNIVNKMLIISSVFVLILLSGFFYKAYLLKKEKEVRTNLYLMSGESIDDGKDIVSDGGFIVSEDDDVAKVLIDGTIVGKNSGSTNITVYKNIDRHDFLNLDSKTKKDKSLYDMYNDLGIEGEFTFKVIVKQKATGVSLNSSLIKMNVGQTHRLVANVFPFLAHNKDVIWSSSNTSVAVVDSKGVVSSRGVGSTTITVTTKDGNFKDSTIVNVFKKESENDIFLDLDSDSLYVNDSANLITVVSPNETLLSKVVYSSSDSSVASVNSYGKIVAKKRGKTTITARIASEGISSSIDIEVLDREVENLYLSSNRLTLNVSDTYNLKAYIYPKGASGIVTYTSSDSGVVSVDSHGKIVALNKGEAVITVKSGNVVSYCKVHVKNDFVKATDIEVLLDESSIKVGEKTFLKVNVFPLNALDKEVSYVSSDDDVVQVFDDGSILGVGLGNALIIATNSAGVSKSVSVKVEEGLINVEQINTTPVISLYAGKSSRINFSVKPSYVANTNIVWDVEDTNIAKVNKFGVVTGVRAGSTVVTATIGEVKSATVINVLEIKPEKIDLMYEELKLFIGDHVTIRSTIWPSDVTNSELVWTSNDENVVKVDDFGNVTAIREGGAVITATSKTNHNILANCVVNVSKIGVESFDVSHDQIVVTEGENIKLSVDNIKPHNASYKEVNYKIGDESVATVSNGVVTGVKTGKTTVTVTIDGISKVIDLNVVPIGDKVYFINTYTSINGPSDAILLESDGKYGMIDTGNNVSSMKTTKFLKDLGVKKLEFIIITHFNSDNFGGIYGENATNNILLSGIKVGKVYIKPYSGSESYFLDSNGYLLTNRESIINRRNVRKDMFLRLKDGIVNNGVSYIGLNVKNNYLELGRFKLNLYNLEDQLRAYNSKCLENYNCNEKSNSVVIYAKVNNRSLYFASDIYNAYNNKKSKYLKNKTEEEVAKAIMKEHGGNIDLYKVANYGNGSSNVNGALGEINPSYSIITNSKSYFLNNDTSGIERIKQYTSNDVYYAGDGTIITNIDSLGNISFIQLKD